LNAPEEEQKQQKTLKIIILIDSEILKKEHSCITSAGKKGHCDVVYTDAIL